MQICFEAIGMRKVILLIGVWCWFGIFGLQAQQSRVVNKKAFSLFQHAQEAFRTGEREKHWSCSVGQNHMSRDFQACIC